MAEMSSVMWAVILVGQGLWVFAGVCWSMALDALSKLMTSPDITFAEAELMERPAERAVTKATVASVLAYVIAQLNAGVLYFAPWASWMNYAFCMVGLVIVVVASCYNYSLYVNVTRYLTRISQQKGEGRAREVSDEIMGKSVI